MQKVENEQNLFHLCMVHQLTGACKIHFNYTFNASRSLCHLSFVSFTAAMIVLICPM